MTIDKFTRFFRRKFKKLLKSKAAKIHSFCVWMNSFEFEWFDLNNCSIIDWFSSTIRVRGNATLSFPFKENDISFRSGTANVPKQTKSRVVGEFNDAQHRNAEEQSKQPTAYCKKIGDRLCFNALKRFNGGVHEVNWQYWQLHTAQKDKNIYALKKIDDGELTTKNVEKKIFNCRSHSPYLDMLLLYMPNVFNESIKSNRVRSISASYLICVHAGKQLHFSRYNLTESFVESEIISSPYNFSSASW